MQVPASIQRMIREAERLGRIGNVTGAIGLYDRALALWPDLPDSWYNLGLLQRRANQVEAALVSYQQALDRGVQRPEEVRLNRSVIFTDCLRDDAAAQRELEHALHANPRYIPALQNLANLQSDRGERIEAARTYERIFTLDPHAYEALARYAQLEPWKAPEPTLVSRLEAALGDPRATLSERASLSFALARVLENTGDYRRAFVAATAANGYSRASASPPPRYDRAAQERLVDALIHAFPAAPPPTHRARAARTSEAANAAPRPIFICGMFRSGSTLAENLLGAEASVANGGELDLLPSIVQARLGRFPASMAHVRASELDAVAREYLAGLARPFPAAKWITDKRPGNFLYVGLIRALFPDARIVHTVRSPLDTCLSIYFQHLDHSISYALDLLDIGHYFRQYRRLMAHWNALYPDIFELSYEALVRDPPSTGKRLFAYCGLEWRDEYLDFARQSSSIKTASVWQIREGLYQGATGRSRHFAEELAALAREL